MTITVADTALNIEKKAINHCTRRNRLHSCLIWVYCGIFLMSFASFYVFWYTDTFSNLVFSQLKLQNGTRSFNWWQHPPIKLEYRIRIFNYTNAREFETGMANKLRVQELGPYIYRETKDRVNMVIHENGTVTFQEKTSYVWIGGSPENDVVVVPNVPMMLIIAFARDLNFPIRFFTNTVLSTLQERTFINVTAGGFLWGFDNRLFHIVKPFLMLKQNILFDKFGILVTKSGVNKNYITMNTGSQDLHNLGMIERVNGIDNRKIWGDEKCDRIMGSDGSMFPPYLIKNTSEPLYVYSDELCRNLPLRFAEQVTTHGIPSLRYKLTPNVFNLSDTQNKCFCPKVNGLRVCPPAGLFDVSACSDGVPLVSSFPHFYSADKSLLEQIDGLNPRQKDHETYIDLHPRIAIPMAGWSRFQINLKVRKAIGVSFLEELEDNTILPLIWIEIGIDKIPELILNIFQTAYFTVTNVEMALQWCSLIVMMLSLSALVTYLWKYYVQQTETETETEILQKNPFK